MLGQEAVVDDIVSHNQVAEWRETASRFSARLFLIECVCSDEAVHRERIENRVRDIPGWHEVGWEHVNRMRTEITPLTVDRLTLNALDTSADNLLRALEYIAA
jgi:hypothetical protein